MARLSSRKFVSVDTIKDAASSRIVGYGGRFVAGDCPYFENNFAVVHRDGVVLGRTVMEKSRAYTRLRTSRDGTDYVFTRYHEMPKEKASSIAAAFRAGSLEKAGRLGIGFDMSHLKRVVDTVLADVRNFREKQVNIYLENENKEKK